MKKFKVNKEKIKNLWIVRFFYKYKIKLSNFLWTIVRTIGKIRFLFLVYFLIILIATLFLYSPLAQKDRLNFLDTFFTSISAFSVTGLQINNIDDNFNVFGQIIIALLIIIGGVGFFALKIYFFNFLLKRSPTIFENELLSIERGAKNKQTLKGTVVVSITLIFSLILISSFIFTMILYFQKPTFDIKNNSYHNFSLSLRYGVFHAISSINNAGFGIINENSLAPYYDNYFLQILTLFLFIIGGIGYPVIYDLYLWYKNKIKKDENNAFKFSLFTKISLFTYFFLALIGIIFVLYFEISSIDSNSFWNKSHSDVNYYHYINNNNVKSPYNYGNKTQKVWALIFMVFSSRNAGISTFDLYDLTDSSLLIVSILMFIGASPSSTGGGIRTTTFALIFITIFSRMVGKEQTNVFKKKIKDSTVMQAIIIFCSAIILFFISLIIIITSLDTHGGHIQTNIEAGKRHYNILRVIFEISSAFGTTGFSIGIINKLNALSKIIFMILMFIGQIGIFSTILIWGYHNTKIRKINYVEDDILIG